MAGLNEFISRLERMAASDVKARIAQKIRPVAHDECLRGFRERRNPYGVPWAPRKDPRGSWPLLDKTGRGVESLTSSAVGETVRLRMVDYMRFAQTGTKNAPDRKIFPEQAQGLGTWSAPVNRAAVDAVREMAEGRG